MYPELEKHKSEKRLIFHTEVYFTLQHVRDRTYCVKDQILQATFKGTEGIIILSTIAAKCLT